MDNRYNGWKNYETWNVALWINSEYDLCKMKEAYGQEEGATYKEFIELTDLDNSNPDGVNWLDENLDYTALDEFIQGV